MIDDLLDPDAMPCSLCARLRRGVLYRLATELGATKIALGHHSDDFIETLLINLFFAGALKAMPAKLLSDDKRHVVIRPLVYVSEDEARCTQGVRAAGHRLLLPCVRRPQFAAAADQALADGSGTRASRRQVVAAEGARQCHAEAPARSTLESAREREARSRFVLIARCGGPRGDAGVGFV